MKRDTISKRVQENVLKLSENQETRNPIYKRPLYEINNFKNQKQEMGKGKI